MYCVGAGWLHPCISFSPSGFSPHLNFPPFRKSWHLKESRGKAEKVLGALSSHLSGNKTCLCGCSLRTKAVLHPRPLPVSYPASQVLPNLSSGKKQLFPPVTVFRDKPSQRSPKPKAKAMSQLSCNAVSLRKLVPMGVWPRKFLDPLSKSLPEESPSTSVPSGGSHFPSQGATSPILPLVKGDKPHSFLPSLFK